VPREYPQFQEFYAAHYPRLRRLGYWLTGDWTVARSSPRRPWSGPGGAGRSSVSTTGPTTMLAGSMPASSLVTAAVPRPPVRPLPRQR